MSNPETSHPQRWSTFRNISLALSMLLFASSAAADEGGVSIWLPGANGSFAAVPGVPGWSFNKVYYHTSVDVGGNVQFPRGGRIDAGLEAKGDLILFGPTYTLAEPIWNGGMLSLSVLAVGGRMQTSVDATLTGPNGNQINGGRTDTLTSYGDLFPKASIAWNAGVNNYMLYAMGALPVGDYKPSRLANTGLGHGAIDIGGAYTYLNPASGFEASITAGVTYNFENPDTNYQNGIDGHIDWAVSQFFTEQFHAGVVGYAYQQLTGDSGGKAFLGDFKSRVFGIGPQMGYKFAVNDTTAGYINLKGFYEFGAENRPEGWNTWLTLSFSPAPPPLAK